MGKWTNGESVNIDEFCTEERSAMKEANDALYKDIRGM
jgi:hypothetical protein